MEPMDKFCWWKIRSIKQGGGEFYVIKTNACQMFAEAIMLHVWVVPLDVCWWLTLSKGTAVVATATYRVYAEHGGTSAGLDNQPATALLFPAMWRALFVHWAISKMCLLGYDVMWLVIWRLK